MSADDTVVVLVTKGRDGGSPEYRVVHITAAERLFWDGDYPSPSQPKLNRAAALDVFRDVRVIRNADEALSEAARIERSVEPVEYGVRVFHLSDVFFPASHRRRRRKSGRFLRDYFQSGAPAH